MPVHEEIFEQPRVIEQWLDTQMDAANRIAESIRKREIDYVVLAARGTSDNAGIYAQYLFGSRNRLPVALAAPSLFTMYPQSPRLERALVVGVSQSGRSPDIVSVLEEGRSQGAATLAITNYPDSPLSNAAEMKLGLHAGTERSIAATKTYTTELIALAALSVALAGCKQEDLDALHAVPAAMQAALDREAETEQVARRYAGMDQCLVLGRGYNYATAQEWALKLKELSYVFTDVYSSADFLHGPIAVLEEGFPVFAVVPQGALLESEMEVLTRLRDDYKANLVVLSDSEQALSLAHAGLHLPTGVPEWLTPIPAIVPAQLFCYHLTLAKGYDVEHPRTLIKVTLTR
jgi:glutamine---fructose-6-phosphate transaminase (isomerizing)